MSRALDPKVKEALRIGHHTPVYRCVADVLSTREEELLDIEVLGPSHILPDDTFTLHEGNAVAIPKLNILRAFLPAYKIFKEHIDGQHVAPKELLRATSVILLLDPEHMTAANARKRYIRHVNEQNPEELDAALEAELYFTDSLLTSRLHRHTKSPTLWGHRQWLLEMCIDKQRPVDSLLTALERLIFVSAERHPRNYYAWCHARYLLGLASRRSTRRIAADGDEQGQQQQTTINLDEVVQTVKKWCFRHPDDISGWSFLMVLVEQQHPEAATTAPALFSETLHLAEAFSWRGESVWYFLRHMLRNNWRGVGDGEEFERVLRTVHSRVNEPGALDRQILSRMLEWTRLYAEPGGLLMSEKSSADARSG
ncbi:hypothetical protein LLEC1_01765 [Akanthomyces lecanii]|uniref:Protein prenyltransferase n=1 Tax=Cordyceps confragosa TaxID=2714763 RepID=A0A179IM79_CORDF|nr:hypothetical protein LLEC1_01765 [Akanthomyces lecanii]